MLVEELTRRREALENGNWVNHSPAVRGEMCVGWDRDGKALSLSTHRFLNECLAEERYRHGIVPWNDESGRTKEDVLAFLDRAIEKAKEKETD